MVQLHCSEPAWIEQVMKTDCLFTIVSIVKADAEQNIFTDVDALADQMSRSYASTSRDELIKYIKSAISLIGGTAPLAACPPGGRG